MLSPLERIDDLLPAHVLRVAQRETPIPTIAGRAAAAKRAHPELVRADIGQIVGVDRALEVLYGPPVGLSSLRALVAELYQLSFGLDGLAESNVCVCTGAAEGLSALFRCFGTGQRVGLPRGGWGNYQNGVHLAGGEPITVDYFDSNGVLDIDGLARVIDEHQLAVLLANFPNNPTGAVLDEAESRSLAELARDKNILLIADEVYARLRYDAAPSLTLLSYAPDHVVSVGSASKEYLLPGARVGYVVSAHADLTDRVLRKVVRASSASPNVLGQQRLEALLTPDLEDLRAGRAPALIERIRGEMCRRRDALLAVLASHEMAAVGRANHKPAGTIFLMASLPSWWNGDDVSFADDALARGCFSCIPGSAFGLPGSVRLSYGATTLEDITRLDVQLHRFRDAL